MDSVSSRLWFTTPIVERVFGASAVVVAAMSYFNSDDQDILTNNQNPSHFKLLAGYCLNVHKTYCCLNRFFNIYTVHIARHIRLRSMFIDGHCQPQ